MSRLVLFLFFMALTSCAAAQLRSVPQDAKRGEIRHLEDMLVEIDGTPQRLSPGAQIRDADNRLVLPVSLSEKSEVKYLLDGSGMVHRVWILSPGEKAQANDPVTLPAFK